MASAARELVLDASVGIKWHLVDEEDSELAREVLRAYLVEELDLVAPEHIHYEVFNALTVASRRQRQRQTQEEAVVATDEFLQLAIPTITDDALLRAARHLTYRWGCAFYDGLYLALAERLNRPLITADQKLYNLIASHPLALFMTDYRKS